MSDWTKLYLRVGDESALATALNPALDHTEDENGNDQLQLITERYQCVILGTLYEPTGDTITETGPDGETIETPEMAFVPGYHANVITNDAAIVSALAAITISPATPLVKWAA